MYQKAQHTLHVDISIAAAKFTRHAVWAAVAAVLAADGILQRTAPIAVADLTARIEWRAVGAVWAQDLVPGNRVVAAMRRHVCAQAVENLLARVSLLGVEFQARLDGDGPLICVQGGSGCAGCAGCGGRVHTGLGVIATSQVRWAAVIAAASCIHVWAAPEAVPVHLAAGCVMWALGGI